VFVVGGFKQTESERLDPREKKFQSIAPIPRIRWWSASAVVGESLWIIGGGENDKYTNTIFEFDVRGDKWMTSPITVSKPIGAFSGVVIGSDVFVVGDEMLRFNTTKKQWTSLAKPHTSHLLGSAVVVNLF